MRKKADIPRMSREQLPEHLELYHIRAYTGCGRDHAYKIRNADGCPKVKKGRKVYVPRDLFIEWWNGLALEGAEIA